jgi:hypothetical protein
MQPLDLRPPGALIHRPPAHIQPAAQFRPQGGMIEPVGGHGMGIELPRIQRRPAAIGANSGVLDQHVGVPLGITLAAGPMIKRGRGDAASAEPVDAVVAPTHPDRLLFQPAQHLPHGDMAGSLNFRPDFRAASGGQQAHALRVGKRQIKGRHSGIDPFADMLACFRVRVAIELLRVCVKNRAAHALYSNRRHLPGSGDALQLLPEPLTIDQFTDVDPTGGGKLPQRRLEGPGVQSGAGIGPPQRHHPLLTRQRVLTCEQSVYRLVLGDTGQPGLLGQGAHPPAGRLALARVVLTAIAGDLVQPVGLLTHPQRRHTQRQTNTSPRPQQTARIVDAAVLKIWILVSSVRATAIDDGK